MNQGTPLLVIVGETASGKSKLALKLAKKLNGSIIAADAWTTRKQLDIGTAKPTKKQQKEVKHYLLDLIEPDEGFTVAEFKPLAEKAIEDIDSRGKLPIMVGGSGLYIDSVIYNYGFLDAGSSSQRATLNNMTIDELLVLIDNLGINIAESIDKRNKRRLIRLIETGGRIPSKEDIRSNTLLIGINPEPELRRSRIEARVQKMISSGLEQEVKTLSEKYSWECDALKGVGYRQWQNYFQGNQDLSETKAQIVNATLNLAKKQRTWFKRNKSIHWLSEPISTQEIVELVTTKLSNLHFN